MFQIIQILRVENRPRTAQSIAEELEVAKRTIYRDVATLQAMRVPIAGEPGIGYVLNSGFDLPPINFSIEEAEAITVGLALISRTGDKGLVKASRHAALKLSNATNLSQTLFASTWGIVEPEAVDLSEIRMAIREELMLSIDYQDGGGTSSNRTVLPIALAYHSEVVILAAWCRLRDDFRHFRVDRITALQMLEESFVGKGAALRKEWINAYSDRL